MCDLRNRAVRHDAIPGTVGSRFGGLGGYPAEEKLFFLALAFAWPLTVYGSPGEDRSRQSGKSSEMAPTRDEARARQGQENSLTLTDKSRAGPRDFVFARLPRNAPAHCNRA